jgi:hypothetical protein
MSRAGSGRGVARAAAALIVYGAFVIFLPQLLPTALPGDMPMGEDAQGALRSGLAPVAPLRARPEPGHSLTEEGKMAEYTSWRVAGLYFEACNCDSVCPCYSARPPTFGYCEGPCVWHITEGRYGEVALDGLNVVMVQRTDGLMRETPWQCWFYLDQRATDAQIEALQHIFTAAEDGYLARTFGRLWQVQGFERAAIEVRLDGRRQRASILGKLGAAIGRLRPEVGPTLCRIPNVPGLAAIAEEDWFADGGRTFDYRGQNALSTTFVYENDPEPA